MLVFPSNLTMCTKMNRIELITYVILLYLLTFISETFGIHIVFDLSNPVIKKHSLPLSPTLVQEISKNLRLNYEVIQDEIDILLDYRSEFKKLTQLDPSYKTDGGIIVQPIIIFTNIINAKLSKDFIETIDMAFGSNFECLSASLQIVPPNDVLKPQNGSFRGFLSCLFAISGNSNLTISVDRQVFHLVTKSVLIFDPTELISMRNNSAEELILIRFEFRRPLVGMVDLLNQVVLQILGTSELTFAACEAVTLAVN